jgi:hypothetical protein
LIEVPFLEARHSCEITLRRPGAPGPDVSRRGVPRDPQARVLAPGASDG